MFSDEKKDEVLQTKQQETSLDRPDLMIRPAGEQRNKEKICYLSFYPAFSELYMAENCFVKR